MTEENSIVIRAAVASLGQCIKEESDREGSFDSISAQHAIDCAFDIGHRFVRTAKMKGLLG